MTKTSQQIVKDIRDMLRDEPRLNRLINGVEHSDDLIRQAYSDVVTDYNATPPFIGDIAGNQIPVNYYYILKLGCVLILLESLMLLYTRNRLPYSDGGVTVDLFGKSGDLASFIAMKRPEYEKKKKDYKIALNIMQGWGGVYSEYILIADYYDWLSASESVFT